MSKTRKKKAKRKQKGGLCCQFEAEKSVRNKRWNGEQQRDECNSIEKKRGQLQKVREESNVGSERNFYNIAFEPVWFNSDGPISGEQKGYEITNKTTTITTYKGINFGVTRHGLKHMESLGITCYDYTGLKEILKKIIPELIWTREDRSLDKGDSVLFLSPNAEAASGKYNFNRTIDFQQQDGDTNIFRNQQWKKGTLVSKAPPDIHNIIDQEGQKHSIKRQFIKSIDKQVKPEIIFNWRGPDSSTFVDFYKKLAEGGNCVKAQSSCLYYSAYQRAADVTTCHGYYIFKDAYNREFPKAIKLTFVRFLDKNQGNDFETGKSGDHFKFKGHIVNKEYENSLFLYKIQLLDEDNFKLELRKLNGETKDDGSELKIKGNNTETDKISDCSGSQDRESYWIKTEQERKRNPRNFNKAWIDFKRTEQTQIWKEIKKYNYNVENVKKLVDLIEKFLNVLMLDENNKLTELQKYKTNADNNNKKIIRSTTKWAKFLKDTWCAQAPSWPEPTVEDLFFNRFLQESNCKKFVGALANNNKKNHSTEGNFVNEDNNSVFNGFFKGRGVWLGQNDLGKEKFESKYDEWPSDKSSQAYRDLFILKILGETYLEEVYQFRNEITKSVSDINRMKSQIKYLKFQKGIWKIVEMWNEGVRWLSNLILDIPFPSFQYSTAIIPEEIDGERKGSGGKEIQVGGKVYPFSKAIINFYRKVKPCRGIAPNYPAPLQSISHNLKFSKALTADELLHLLHGQIADDFSLWATPAAKKTRARLEEKTLGGGKTKRRKRKTKRRKRKTKRRKHKTKRRKHKTKRKTKHKRTRKR